MARPKVIRVANQKDSVGKSTVVDGLDVGGISRFPYHKSGTKKGRMRLEAAPSPKQRYAVVELCHLLFGGRYALRAIPPQTRMIGKAYLGYLPTHHSAIDNLWFLRG